MQPKPKHLGVEYAQQFQDRSVAVAYSTRPPYPTEVFEILRGLLGDGPRAVLDIGCGTGDIARRLAAIVERVDAVDFSREMVARGKQLPGGDDTRLSWVVGRVEEAPLRPPYGLVTAGESLHWMDWAIVLPRCREVLAPGGYLAIVGRGDGPNAWDAALLDLIKTYSTNRDFQPYNLVEELEARSLFTKTGERHTAPMPFAQPVEAYIESFHSRNGFSRERMRPEDAAAFDARVRELVTPYSEGGMLHLDVFGVVVWGEAKGA